jgi:hypothetical protein
MDTDQNGTENFLLIDGHLRGYVIDNGRGDEVALRVLGVHVLSAVQYYLGTLFFSSTN